MGIGYIGNLLPKFFNHILNHGMRTSQKPIWHHDEAEVFVQYNICKYIFDDEKQPP